MRKPLLDIGADGTAITYDEDREGRALVISEFPDVASAEKWCAESRARRMRHEKGEFRHVMKIPQAVLTKICADTGLNFFDDEDARRILEIVKRDYSAFVSYPGKV